MNFCLIRTLARAGWLLLLLSTLMSEAQEPRKLDDTPWAGSTRGLSEPDLPAGLFADLRPNTFTVIGPSSTFLKTAGPTSLQRPRSHLVRVDLLRLAAVRDEVRSRGQVRLPLNLFADVTLDAVIERTTETRSGYTLSGVVDGDPMSSVVLVINDAVVAGMVNSVKGTWLIESRGAGVVEIRRSKGTFQCDVRASAESVMPVRQRTALAKSANQDDGDEIDVLVLFTAAARNRQGGYEGMRAHIDLWVASANEAYRMSGAVQRINLVAVVEVDYQESLESLYTDYYFLYDKNDGHMDEIHNLRDSYAADLVCLVIDNPIAGGGGVAGSPLDPSMDPDIAFAVVEVEDDPSTFAHELGHLMGLKHDRYVLIYYGGSDRLNKPFAYAHGYVNQRAFDPGTPKQSRWRTIMAYPTQIVDVTGSTNIADNQQIMRFSNPKQFHHGDPLGVPGDDPSEAVDGPADAVRTLNNTRSLVANYRQRADACRFTLSETKRTVDQAGTSFSVNVEGAGRCSYLAWSTNDFLTLSKESGSGGDEMVVRVAPNAGGARTGYVIVAGETLTINQSGAGSFLSVCKRTPIVAGKLMALTNRLKCEDVTEFDLLNIGSLDLTSQGIAALTSEDFDGLWNLRELNLSNNRFSRLPEGVFDDLTSLNRLEIQGIELFDQLPATAFDALSELTSLSLNLPLKRIERGTFDRLTSLRVLDLGHCQLRSLPDDLFANLTELNYLYLQGNQFEEIPRALHGLDNLYTLMLSTNPLKTLPANAFAGLPELWSLYLSNTSLSSIAKDAFSGLANLQRLYLQNERMYLPNNEILWFENKNEIKDLSGVVLPGGSIGILNLSGNALSSLPPDLFRGFTSEACNGTASSLRLNFTDNPGSPFSLVVELLRVDADNAAASPARVVARVREGAPWPLTVDLALDGGSLSATRVVIPNGSVQSEPFEVTVDRADQSVTIRLESVTELPPSYKGIKTVKGKPLRLFASAQATPDFNGDGTVNISDFLLFVSHFGTSHEDAGYDVRFDLDEDGAIGISDFLIFVNAFGKAG